ncbi:hypothetical protein BJX99DRAFT_244785 [Aspergillus californicus]
MSRAAVNVLKKWFDQHQDCPYPSKQEKAYLVEKTSLTVIQVSNWFANARRRRKAWSARRIGMGSVTRRNSLELYPKADDISSAVSPLERWRNSPPEAEAASLDAIMSAVVQNRRTGLPEEDLNIQSSQSTPNDSRSFASSNPSESGTSNSSASSAYSFGSHTSNGSFNQFYAIEPTRRRRRRKRPAYVLPKTAGRSGPDQRPYQCTFCTDTFRAKYDWTRHEKTLHLSLESYTCSPSGPTYLGPDAVDRCAFCDYSDPSENHIDSHSYQTCREKPAVLRTFYRKDHLVQHLRLVHGTNRFIPEMDNWKVQIDNVNSRCGFCSSRFVSWKERNEHIADHYRNGISMKDWRGPRGLDPPVALAVQNAMPPYLIGIEATGMDPFSASRLSDVRLASDDGQEDANVKAAGVNRPTSFEYLTARLTEFVRAAQAAQEDITDNTIQTQARHIMYGDDDPWNQTPADNCEWLELRDEWSFYLPWSTEPWTPWGTLNASSDVPNNLSGQLTRTPWSWQSPEAFAEFRRFCAEVLLTGASDEPGNVVFR